MQCRVSPSAVKAVWQINFPAAASPKLTAYPADKSGEKKSGFFGKIFGK